MNKPIPEVGKTYHFFDDGKISPSRHYMVKILRVIPKEGAKNIVIKIDDHEPTGTLYDIWDETTVQIDWVFAKDTDYFVEGECREYDDHNLWFARTVDGGWYSMDVQSWWMGGELDIDGSIYEYAKQTIKDYDKSRVH